MAAGPEQEGTVIGGYPRGTRAWPSWALYWESHSVNCLTWPTDCKYTVGLARRGATSR